MLLIFSTEVRYLTSLPVLRIRANIIKIAIDEIAYVGAPRALLGNLCSYSEKNVAATKEMITDE